MSGRRVSIAQGMVVVALAAVNLANARATPWEIASSPGLWVVMGILDFLIVWKLILRRPFRAFHYTFLFVFVVAFFILIHLAWRLPSPHPPGPSGPVVRATFGREDKPGLLIGFANLCEW